MVVGTGGRWGATIDLQVGAEVSTFWFSCGHGWSLTGRREKDFATVFPSRCNNRHRKSRIAIKLPIVHSFIHGIRAIFFAMLLYPNHCSFPRQWKYCHRQSIVLPSSQVVGLDPS
jgi:hypothetical protein